jgi:hypothetical protein
VGRSKCVAVSPPAGGLATLRIKFKAQTLIKVVVLIPGYTNTASSWPRWQTNVAIYAKIIAGTQQPCGVLSDYTTYSEALCNFQANEIVVV